MRLPTSSALAIAIATALGALVLPAAARAAKVSVNDLAITAIDRAIVIDVLANDIGLGAVQVLSVSVRPRNGTAQVVDGRITYTPAAGYTGRDRFSYLVKSGRRIGIGNVVVDVGSALTLRGKVTDDEIPLATVTATLNGNRFTTQADASGAYALEIIGAANGMVTLDAVGGAGQPSVRFQSVVGDFERLAVEAGDDDALAREENNQVQVTNVSTAQAYLMQQALDGAPITDDATLTAARDALDYTRLMRAAAAIKLVVDEGFALPAGVTDTLALLNDEGAFAQFVADAEAQSPGALEAAAQEIAADPDLTEPVSAGDAVGAYTLLFNLGAPGTISSGFGQGDRIELEPGGTGVYLKAGLNPDPSITWSLDNGRIVVVPNAPLQQTSFPVIEGFGQVRQLITERRLELSKLGEANGRTSFAVSTTFDFTYPDTPQLPPGEATQTGTQLGIRDEDNLPYGLAEVPGTRALPITGTPFVNSNGNGHELLTFLAGGSGTRADGVNFNWTLDPAGRLQVLYAGGAMTTYSRISTDGRKGEGVVAESRTAAGARAQAWSIAGSADGSLAFTDATAAGAWRSGFFISRVSVDPTSTDFFMVFNADAMKSGAQVSYSSIAAFVTPVGWATSAGGALLANYYRNGNNQPVTFCTIGVDGCYLWQQRRWRPVSVDGARAYVIEEFLFDTDLNGSIEVTNQRGNFYDLSPRPDFSVAPEAPAPKALRKR